MKWSKEDFINRAREIHGNKYEYSLVEYKNITTKVDIYCPKHGIFSMRPSDHIYSHCGCTKCSGLKQSNTEDFIEKSLKKYGEKYDYSKVEYKNNKTKVCILCHQKDEFGNEHGEFWQRPNDHLSGYECPKCKKEYIPTTKEWIRKAKQVHGDRYDYSKVEYKGAFEKVCIICPKHGEFWQRPSNHIANKSNCPYCNTSNKSHMEENIRLLLTREHITHECQKTFEWLKYKKHLYIDFFLPQQNIAIEVQGEQHFVPTKRFGGIEFLEKQEERDRCKRELCEKHGIKMFYITKKNYNINEILNFINGSNNTISNTGH